MLTTHNKVLHMLDYRLHVNNMTGDKIALVPTLYFCDPSKEKITKVQFGSFYHSVY